MAFHNGWYGRAARQSCSLRLPVRIQVTDQCWTNTSLKLCREAACTICSANCTICRLNSDLYTFRATQHRRGAMLAGMDTILVQQLHALRRRPTLRSKSTVLCCLETNPIADVAVLQKISCCCKIVCHTPSCSHPCSVQVHSFLHPTHMIFNTLVKSDKLRCNFHLAYCVFFNGKIAIQDFISMVHMVYYMLYAITHNVVISILPADFHWF